MEDSDNSSNHSDEPRKVDGFPSESLDAFDRNQWMTCVGIRGWLRPEWLDDLPRNTQALDRGHVVTAIVRHPEKLEKRDGLTAKAGDVYDTASLATLIRGNEAIISAFNPGWKNPKLYDDQVRGTASIIAAIKKAGIERVLWVGGAGGLEVKPGVRVIDSPDMPLWVKPGALATINALDQLRKEPELEWSCLSPSADLKPGQRTGKFRLGNDQLLVGLPARARFQFRITPSRWSTNWNARPMFGSALR
jgi:uncharacterized protein